LDATERLRVASRGPDQFAAVAADIRRLSTEATRKGETFMKKVILIKKALITGAAPIWLVRSGKRRIDFF